MPILIGIVVIGLAIILAPVVIGFFGIIALAALALILEYWPFLVAGLGVIVVLVIFRIWFDNTDEKPSLTSTLSKENPSKRNASKQLDNSGSQIETAPTRQSAIQQIEVSDLEDAQAYSDKVRREIEAKADAKALERPEMPTIRYLETLSDDEKEEREFEIESRADEAFIDFDFEYVTEQRTALRLRSLVTIGLMDEDTLELFLLKDEIRENDYHDEFMALLETDVLDARSTARTKFPKVDPSDFF